MPSLIDCLELAGKLFQKDEKEALLRDAKTLQEQGMTQADAEKQAVRNQIEEGLKTLRDIHQQAGIKQETPAPNLEPITEDQNAQQDTQTTEVYGDVQQPEGAQESQGEVPPSEGSEGIPQPQKEITGDEKFSPNAPRGVPVAPGASSVTEWRTRNFARRFTQDERIDSEAREQVPTEYLPITNQDTVDEVNRKIDENGLVASASQVMNFTNDLTPAQRVVMAESVLLKINDAVKLAKRQNRVEDAAELNSLASDVAMEISSFGTRLGQGIQAFSIWNRLTPEGLLATAEKTARQNGRPEGLTNEEKTNLRPLAEQASEAPKGFLQNDAMRKYFTEVAKIKGVKFTESLTAYWYANILSGLNTQGINIFGSGINGAIQAFSQSLTTNPVDTFRFIQGMASAATDIAAKEGTATFLTGSEASRLLKKFEAEPSSLEALYTENPKTTKDRIKNAFSYGQYVFRALQAGDAFMYRTFNEGQAYLEASRAARQKGNYWKSFLDELGMSDEVRSDAIKQAESEVQEFGANKTPRQTKRDIARRAFEIMEGKRDAQLRASADRFASLSTYTNEPEGALGLLAGGMNKLIESVSFDTPVGRIAPLRFVIPFVNIVANVANSQLDMTPLGLVRAVRGKALGSATMDAPRERIRRATNAVVGAGMTALVAGLAEAMIDDEDPWFAVYGEGPKDLERKRNLMSQGWKPYTIKIGDKYLRYNETPLNLVFATIGGVHDAQRYGQAFNRKKMAEQAAYVTTIGMRSFSEASFLSSIMSLVDVLNGKQDVGAATLQTAKGLIPAQGLLRDISKSLDPEIVDKKQGLWPAIASDIPVVKEFGTRPMLNSFGDPIEYSFFDRLPFAGRLFSERTDQPEWRYLAEKGLRLPGLNRPIETGVAGLTKREKRALAEVMDDRAAVLGKYAAEIFSSDEEYEFIEKSGPKIKEAVKQLRTEHSDMGTADQQDWLEKKVREIRTQTKKEILGID